jgi:hypothetical protein
MATIWLIGLSICYYRQGLEQLYVPPCQNQLWGGHGIWRSYHIKSYVSQPHFGISVRVKPTLPKVRTWSLLGLSKTQSSMSGVKSPRIWVFFMSSKRSWSLDVQNGLTWTIRTYAAQVMGKRKAKSQIDNLTPDH